jgi:hypothetical protein
VIRDLIGRDLAYYVLGGLLYAASVWLLALVALSVGSPT